jgi:hypothetical protein
MIWTSGNVASKEKIETDPTLPETDRQAIVNARRGQGLFKQRVTVIERRCRVTLVENPLHLIASHCKPWRDATNEERLDGENGLLLTPSIDHLLERVPGTVGVAFRRPEVASRDLVAGRLVLIDPPISHLRLQSDFRSAYHPIAQSISQISDENFRPVPTL